MAGNIYGYQGVHTPLESVTQGRYTLSDYTNMKTELTARLIALENQGGFVPTNVEITGYLHMLPGGAGSGEIETTSSITGGSLYINQEAHVGNLVVDNSANFGGSIAFNGDITTLSSVNANAANVNGAVTCSSLNSSQLNSSNILNLNGVSGVSVYGNNTLGLSVNSSGQTTTKQLRVDSDIRLLDVFSPGSGKQSQMYHTNTQLVLYNLENSGSIHIRNKNSTGAYAQGILLSYTDCTITTSNCPQINGFTLPSTSDSTSKVATTQWVQSVISSLPSPTPSPPSYVYVTTSALMALNSGYYDNIIQTAPNIYLSFYFTARTIGQRYTIIRTNINGANGNQFFWNAGSLPYRVFTLDGTQTDLNSAGPVAAITYTYAGQQKIRSVFLVVASQDVNYSFDLIEIS